MANITVLTQDTVYAVEVQGVTGSWVRPEWKGNHSTGKNISTEIDTIIDYSERYARLGKTVRIVEVTRVEERCNIYGDVTVRHEVAEVL